MKPTSSSTSLMEALAKVREDDGVEVQRAPELSGLRLGFTGEHGHWLCFAEIHEERRVAISLFDRALRRAAGSPRRGDALRDARVLQAAARALELDLDDGEVRFRTTLALGEASVHPSLLGKLVRTNVAAMDRYLPGLVATSQQGLSAEKALTLVVG